MRQVTDERMSRTIEPRAARDVQCEARDKCVAAGGRARGTRQAGSAQTVRSEQSACVAHAGKVEGEATSKGWDVSVKQKQTGAIRKRDNHV